jgi:chemotaxis family two-component system sensor kinase Cph1
VVIDRSGAPDGTLIRSDLIGSAIKFRRSDRPCQVRIATAQREGEWVFSVRDNGIGIASEFQERVFVIFRRPHGPGTYPGAGVTLYFTLPEAREA